MKFYVFFIFCFYTFFKSWKTCELKNFVFLVIFDTIWHLWRRVLMVHFSVASCHHIYLIIYLPSLNFCLFIRAFNLFRLYYHVKCLNFDLNFNSFLSNFVQILCIIFPCLLSYIVTIIFSNLLIQLSSKIFPTLTWYPPFSPQSTPLPPSLLAHAEIWNICSQCNTCTC